MNKRPSQPMGYLAISVNATCFHVLTVKASFPFNNTVLQDGDTNFITGLFSYM